MGRYDDDDERYDDCDGYDDDGYRPPDVGALIAELSDWSEVPSCRGTYARVVSDLRALERVLCGAADEDGSAIRDLVDEVSAYHVDLDEDDEDDEQRDAFDAAIEDVLSALGVAADEASEEARRLEECDRDDLRREYWVSVMPPRSGLRWGRL